MGKKLLIHDYQKKIEKWNCKAEHARLHGNQEFMQFCLRAIENIEGSDVYKMAQKGIDVSGFTIEEFTFGDNDD